MIKLKPFKRSLLMPSNRRPRVSSLNDYVRGDSIRSNGLITCYPCPVFFSSAISFRYNRQRSKF